MLNRISVHEERNQHACILVKGIKVYTIRVNMHAERACMLEGISVDWKTSSQVVSTITAWAEHRTQIINKMCSHIQGPIKVLLQVKAELEVNLQQKIILQQRQQSFITTNVRVDYGCSTFAAQPHCTVLDTPGKIWVPCAHTFAAQPQSTVWDILGRKWMPCAHSFAARPHCTVWDILGRKWRLVLTLLLLNLIALSEIFLAESDALCSHFCCPTTLHYPKYLWETVYALCPHVCCGCPVPAHLLWMPCAHTFAVPTRLLCPHACYAHTFAVPTRLLLNLCMLSLLHQCSILRALHSQTLLRTLSHFVLHSCLNAVQCCATTSQYMV